MSQIGSKLRSLEGGLVAFHCPGCDTRHVVGVKDPAKPKWSWNQDADAPTFSPSIRVRSVKQLITDEEYDQILKEYPNGSYRDKLLEDSRYSITCHSHVTDGYIRFLGDTTHSLSGQVVELPDVNPEGFN